MDLHLAGMSSEVAIRPEPVCTRSWILEDTCQRLNPLFTSTKQASCQGRIPQPSGPNMGSWTLCFTRGNLLPGVTIQHQKPANGASPSGVGSENADQSSQLQNRPGARKTYTSPPLHCSAQAAEHQAADCA